MEHAPKLQALQSSIAITVALANAVGSKWPANRTSKRVVAIVLQSSHWYNKFFSARTTRIATHQSELDLFRLDCGSNAKLDFPLTLG